MTRRRRISGLIVATALVAAGCERSISAPTTQSTTAPTTQAANDDDGETPAVAAIININGRPTVFPAARLRLQHDGERLIATLFSDDPPEALRSNYKGNSFYLRMQLDISDPAELGQADWRHQSASSSEREDSPYGIFLNGRRTQLQPFDVRATFRRDSDKQATIILAGQFTIIDANNDAGPPQTAPASAELTAKLDKLPATTQ